MKEVHFKIGVNIIVIRDGRILLGRIAKEYGRGQWSLPGGHLEKFEGIAAAAERELFEEADLRASAFSFVNLVNEPRPSRYEHYVHVTLVTTTSSGEPHINEPETIGDWTWYAPDALPGDIYDPHRIPIEAWMKGDRLVDLAG